MVGDAAIIPGANAFTSGNTCRSGRGGTNANPEPAAPAVGGVCNAGVVGEDVGCSIGVRSGVLAGGGAFCCTAAPGLLLLDDVDDWGCRSASIVGPVPGPDPREFVERELPALPVFGSSSWRLASVSRATKMVFGDVGNMNVPVMEVRASMTAWKSASIMLSRTFG